jgi:hypothetical protein
MGDGAESVNLATGMTPSWLERGRLFLMNREWPHLLLVFTATFAVYCWSMPRTVVFEDDGLFIMASYFNGIAHPPGYPLFTLLGHLATFLPVGSIAYRVHMVSALFGALSGIVMYKVVQHLFRRRDIAYVAALCLGFSREFWSQAIISEVYTLNVFILLLLILFSIYQAEEDRPFSRRLFYGMAFVYGLGLSNHWPLLILTTPAILLILWPVRRSVIKALPYSIPFLLLGLTPYVWLVIRSHMDPVISFYGPIDSWKEFWFMVSRQGYANTDVDVGANIWDKIHYAWFVIEQTAVQFGPIGFLLGLAGFIRQWRVWRPSFCLALITGYLGSTFVLIGLLGFDYDIAHQNVFRVYPINAYAIMVLWICLGLVYTSAVINKYMKQHLNAVNMEKLLAVLLVGTVLLFNIPTDYRAEDDLAKQYALVVLNSLAKNADFFTTGDIDTFTLGYFNLVKGVRPDVTLYHRQGLIFATRLFDFYTTNEKRRYKKLSEFIEGESRPIYYINKLPKLYGHRFYGLYSRIDKKLKPDKETIVANPDIIRFYERLNDSGKFYDPWERTVQQLMLADYCRLVITFSRDDQQAHMHDVLRACRNYGSLLALADTMLGRDPPDMALLHRLLEEAGKLRGHAQTIGDYITYDILYGRFLLLQDRPREALRHFRLAIREWPDPANPGYLLIKEHTPPAGGKGKAATGVKTSRIGTPQGGY